MFTRFTFLLILIVIMIIIIIKLERSLLELKNYNVISVLNVNIKL